MANPLEAYGKVLTERGLGTPKTKLEAMIESGKLTDPLERFPEKKGTAIDDVQRYFMGLGNILKAGGRSRLPGGAYSPYVVPKNVEEATKQVAAAGEFKPDLTGAKFDEDGNLIGKTPEDFVPFDTNIFDEKNAEILKNLKPGEKPPTKSIMGLMGASDEALAQLGVAENERAERAEEFRAQEEKIAEAQGKPEVGGKALEEANEETEGAQKALDKLFEQSMNDFITNVRGVGPEQRTKSLDEYKKEFAEATGVDISGKVDKSSALMALGLALMQNRAGKGFNVGRILSEVGKAGEAALPALEKAKTRARNDAIAAGKYALETRASDRAVDAANREKSLNRQGYYIFERGKDTEDGNKKFNQGKIVYLNGEEINKLITDENFDKRFSFIKKSEYLDIKKELTKPVERGDMWVKGDPKHFSLIGGDPKDVPPALQVLSHSKNPNYEGETPSRRLLAEDEDDVKARFGRYQEEVLKNKEKMTELVKNLQAGVSFPKQIVGTVTQFVKGLGLDIDTSTTAKAKQALKNIAIDNVLEILKESGRTISEGERKRVEKRVGDIRMNLEGSDLDLILNQVEYVYDMVVNTPQKNLNDALDTFENQFGYSIMGDTVEEEPITQEELDLINQNRKAQGLEPRKMSDF
tara:strand:- start:2991 stop:4904 length:1914 start_codon:yes stop_codon:yes gene_type:complete